MILTDFRPSDWQWFRLRLRIEALEHRAKALGFAFELDQPKASDGSTSTQTLITCFASYDPHEARLESASDQERQEIFLGWRNMAVRMIKLALTDTPELDRRVSIERQFKFVVLEGYGMGSRKVFEVAGDTPASI